MAGTIPVLNRGVCVTMKRETFLIPSTDIQRDKITRPKDKKRGWRIESSTLLELKAPLTKLLAFAESPLVVDDRPGFLFRDNCRSQGDHACASATILDDPEELSVFPLLMELAVREIAGARIQNLTGLTLAISFLTMTIEAGALTLEQCLSFGNTLRS